MARIPTTANKRRLLPQNTRSMASIDVGAVTAPGRALEGLGRSVANTGDVIFDKLERKRKEEDRFALAEARNKYLEGRLQLERDIPENEDRENWGPSYRSKLAELEKEIADTLSEDNQKEFKIYAENDAIRGGHGLLTRASREGEAEANQRKASMDRVNVANAKNRFLRARLELFNKYDDFNGDPNTWGPSYEEELAGIRDQIAQSVPQEYRDAFIAETDGDVITSRARIEGKADAKLLSDARGQLQIDVQENVDLAVGTENSFDRMAVLQSINEEINAAYEGGIITNEEAYNMRQAATNNYAKRRIELLDAEQRSLVLTPGKYGDNIDPQADMAMHKLEAAWGESFTITSGYRDPKHNERVGGASKSQHLHGKAFDVDVSHLSIEERKRLIVMARAAGFGGIGVYNNALHFDVGPVRHWGSNYKKDSTPEWALEALGAPRGELNAPSYADTRLPRYLSPDEAQVYRERADSAYQKELEAKQTRFMDGFGDFVGAIRSGGDVSSDLFQRYSKNGILANVIDDTTRSVMEQAIDEAVRFSDYMSELESMAPSQIMETLNQLKPGAVEDRADVELFPQRQSDYDVFSQAATATVKARLEDPSTAAIKIDPENSYPEDMSNNEQFADRTLATQSSLEIPAHQQQILPNPIASEIGRQFISMEPDAMALAMNEFYKSYGKHGDRAIQELADKGGLPEGLAVAMRYADKPQLAAEVAAIASQPVAELEANLTDFRPVDVRTELNSNLAEYMNVFVTGDITGQALAKFNQNSELAYKLALRYMTEGMSMSNAVDKVTDAMFPEKVVNRGQLKYLVPEEYKENHSQIENYLEALIEVEALQRMDIDPIDDPMFLDFQDEAVSAYSLASSGAWLTNSTGDGATLMYHADGMYYPVRMKNGEMMEVKFKDAINASWNKPVNTNPFGWHPWADKPTPVLPEGTEK